MIALGILLLVVGPLLLLLPHQIARAGRPSSRSGREKYEQGLRRRGVPVGVDEEDGISRVRERIVGAVMTLLAVVLLALG